MVLTLTLAHALSKVLVVTWFFPTGQVWVRSGGGGWMLLAYLLSALCLLAFLFCSSTLHMPSLLFLGCLIRVLRALGWACSSKQYILASQGLLRIFLNSRYSYGV